MRLPNRSLPLLATAALALAGCSDVAPGSPARVHLWQEVQAVEVRVLAGCPQPVEVRLFGGIGACDTVLPVEVNRRGNEFELLVNVRTAAGICIQPLLGHEEIVSLGTPGPGDYTVVARAEFGEKTASFQLDGCP